MLLFVCSRIRFEAFGSPQRGSGAGAAVGRPSNRWRGLDKQAGAFALQPKRRQDQG